MKQTNKILMGLASTLLPFGGMSAQDENATDDLDVLAPFEIIGSKQNVDQLFGIGSYLDADNLSPFFRTDITEILREVPGVYVRGEEGYGLFPNIGIRGVDSTRSSKVTIMEDGIPSAPSPYSDPAAYYSPTAGRMAAFEILKGSSSLKHGPQTTGGVINYISTAIPSERASHARISYGEHNERIAHVYSGGTENFGNGTLGYLVEVFDHRTDGWKTVNGTANFNSQTAEVAKSDIMLKLGYTFGADKGSYLEFKAGRTNLDGDVSYLGLSPADYASNPYQRYAGTRFDNMDSDQSRYYLRFLRELSPDATLSVTGFYNQFNRDWYKISKVGGRSVSYDNSVALVANGQAADSKGVLGATGLAAGTVGILNGTSAGDIVVKHNDRTYTVKGLQANLDYQVNNHDIDLGFRYTDDVYDKNAFTQDTYAGDGAGNFVMTPGSVTAATGFVATESLEIYMVDQIDLGELNLAPGVRYTQADYWEKGNGWKDFDDFLVGVGATYGLSDNALLFGGLHQGHALPGPKSFHDNYAEEQTLSVELGIRGALSNGVGYELAYFNVSYDDLLILPNLGGGNAGTATNAGEASSQGLEATLATDLSEHFETGFKMPTQLTATFTDAEFDTATFPQSGKAWTGASSGNSIPYVPDMQLNLRTGVELEKTSVFLNFRYTDEVYVDAYNSASLGKSGILDLSAFHNLTESAQLFGKVSNLTDEVYQLGRLPDGYRTGAPRALTVGLKFDF